MGRRLNLQIGGENMKLTWKYDKPLNDSMAVKIFLEKYKVRLPSSLIEVMEKHNGGRPSEKTIVTATNQEYVFKAMLSYNEGDKETIYSIYPELFKGKKSFPFASDSAGNFICYDTVSKKYVFYNHETDTEEIIISLLGGLLF